MEHFETMFYDTVDPKELRFTTPFKALFVGASSCGKSELIAKILEHKAELIDKPEFDYVGYYYPGKSLTASRQNYIDRLSRTFTNLEPHEGLPDIDDLASIDGSKLIIVDDLYADVVKNISMHDLMTIHAHHSNISLLITAQNFFTQGKYSKTLLRNYTDIVLFDAKMDRQILDIISSQMFPGGKRFIPLIMEWLRENVKNVHERYIWIDSHPNSKVPEFLRVRSNVVATEKNPYEITFIPPSTNYIAAKKYGLL